MIFKGKQPRSCQSAAGLPASADHVQAANQHGLACVRSTFQACLLCNVSQVLQKHHHPIRFLLQCSQQQQQQ